MSYRPRLNKYVYDFIKSHKNSNICGIISDTHYPFAHKSHLNFLYETFNKFQVNRVVHIGDIVDGHSWSYHESADGALNPSKEAALAQRDIDKLFKMFPEGDLTLGNHDLLIARKCQTHNIPKKFFKNFEEIWNFPKGW
mgnify:FL=1